MIGSRTPFRISFFGGGTDLPEFYTKYTGQVLSTAIDKYMYLFVHDYFDDKIQIKYSMTELVDKISEIKHPIVREVLNKFKLTGLDINSIADVPAGTGLGSSSAYTVGLLNTLYFLVNREVTKHQLAEEASHIEINLLKEPIGKQDQYASSFGGLNLITFNNDHSVEVRPLNIKREIVQKLQDNILIFYTGFSRKASSVLTIQKENTINKAETFDTLCQMSDLTSIGAEALIQGSLEDFADTLHQSWNLKKNLSSGISDEFFDGLYKKGLENGAKGGKILGAGGGGFIMFYADKKRHIDLRNSMSEYKELIFSFDHEGSKIILT